jgi:hypothetical protein
VDDAAVSRPPQNVKDISGQSFGRLTVLSFSHFDRRAHWTCRCDCGEIVVKQRVGVQGGPKSCGCLQREKARALGGASGSHGLTGTALWNVHRGMKERCYNPNSKSFQHYGRRGIGICPEWRDDLARFAEWALSNGYEAGLEIDRRDNDGDYSPENCRWISHKRNCNNTRGNTLVTIGGVTATLAEWSDRSGIPGKYIGRRIAKLGWTPEDAVWRKIVPRTEAAPPARKT